MKSELLNGADWLSGGRSSDALALKQARKHEIAQRRDVRYPDGEVRTMEPRTIPEPTGFSDLSKAEQIRYLQALWDRIAERPGEIPVPESHLEVAEERLAEYRRDPSRAQPARAVLDRLAKKEG